MKEGWEYRKLGEVCNIYQPKTLSSKELVEDGKYLVYGANGVIGKYNSYNHESSEVLMTCRGATCGTINVSKPHSWINGNAMVIHPQQNKLSQNFLFYLLKGLDLSDVITGAAQPQITRQSLAPKKIGIPPLSEQQHIVEELDLLSSIIEKKKAQLKELDNLAQSLFYEMFGDPITNEKGWEVKKLGEICSFSQGIQVDVSKQSTEKITGWNRFLRIVDYTTENDDIRYVNVNDPKYILNKEDIAMVRYGASVGTSDIGKEGVLANNLFKINYSKYVFNKYYLLYSFHTMYFKAFIHTVSFGAAMPALSFKVMKDFQLLQPPLSCQQSFASKIESIEHQKDLIKQSIKEVETLFNSRMDYYFN